MLNYYNIPLLSKSANRIREWAQGVCTTYSSVRNALCPSVPLVYADAVSGEIAADAVLVLAPSDYWVLRVELNVQNEAEAVKYAPALFDLGEGYGFQARKVGENLFVFVAFERSHLAEILRENSLFSSIKKLTFAQWIFGAQEYPIRLKNGKFLTLVEGIVIEMDASYISSERSQSIDEALALSPLFYKTVDRDELLTSEITSKTLKITLGVLVIILINMMAQTALDYQASEEIDAKSMELLDASHLPETSIEREAVVDALKRKEEKQIRFRQQCYDLGMIPMKVDLPEIPMKSALPEIPAAIDPASTEGVVLIPGSKPGEPNRLLVGGSAAVSAATSAVNALGMAELQYDGNSMNLRIHTQSAESSEMLKNEILKKFKKARIEVKEKQLEVRLQ